MTNKNNVYSLDSVAMRKNCTPLGGGVSAVVLPWCVAETTSMQREPVYAYENTDPPGYNIHRLRRAADLSQRALGDSCIPALDHTTIRRVENNKGYTQDTLERIAVALSKRIGAKIEVQDLFLPRELADWPTLPEKVRARLAETIRDAAAAQEYRKTSGE